MIPNVPARSRYRPISTTDAWIPRVTLRICPEAAGVPGMRQLSGHAHAGPACYLPRPRTWIGVIDTRPRLPLASLLAKINAWRREVVPSMAASPAVGRTTKGGLFAGDDEKHAPRLPDRGNIGRHLTVISIAAFASTSSRAGSAWFGHVPLVRVRATPGTSAPSRSRKTTGGRISPSVSANPRGIRTSAFQCRCNQRPDLTVEPFSSSAEEAGR